MVSIYWILVNYFYPKWSIANGTLGRRVVGELCAELGKIYFLFPVAAFDFSRLFCRSFWFFLLVQNDPNWSQYPPEKRFYRLKSVRGPKRLLWGLPVRTFEGVNYQKNSSVVGEWIKEILTRAPPSWEDFGWSPCHVPSLFIPVKCFFIF